MGIFSSHLEREVRLERMRPEQIDAAKTARPAIYVPFGAMEWHGYHNPVGLDGLKAHEQLIGLAVRVGGVVYPPIYFGAGGGHTQWPNSYMVDGRLMADIVTQLLHGFQRDGYTHCVMLSGHYPNRAEYIDSGVAAFRESGGVLKILTLLENQAPGVSGDHAATFETSAMLYLTPDTVNMQTLQGDPTDDIGGPDQTINWMGDQYKGHPCYGLVGTDPRAYASVEVGKRSTQNLLDYLTQWLDN